MAASEPWSLKRSEADYERGQKALADARVRRDAARAQIEAADPNATNAADGYAAAHGLVGAPHDEVGGGELVVIKLPRKAGVARLELVAVRAPVVLISLPDARFALDAPALRLQPRKLFQQESTWPDH